MYKITSARRNFTWYEDELEINEFQISYHRRWFLDKYVGR